LKSEGLFLLCSVFVCGEEGIGLRPGPGLIGFVLWALELGQSAMLHLD
jgi:hypothetical protein